MLIGSREYLDITATGQPGPSPLTLKSESPSDTPSASRTSLVTAGESVILTRLDSSEWATLEASSSSSGPDGRGEHDVGTKTVTGEEDEVSAAAALVQTNLLMPKVQSPLPDSAHAHTDHPSEPVYVQISSRARTLARWAAVEMECGSADCRVPITWTLRRL